jgi:hypothetical protein
MAQEALTQKVESFVKEQWAQLRLVETEASKVAKRAEKEARKAVKSLKTGALKGQKEVRGFLRSSSVAASVETLEGWMGQGRAWVESAVHGASAWRSNVVRAAGFATADDVSALTREVSKLAKKLDAVAKPKRQAP